MARAALLEDTKYPGMWRIQYEDGELSDMYNISRAKDFLRRYLETNRETKKSKDRR
jgi:hypothetical protein